MNGLYPLHEPSPSLFPRKFDLITVVSLFSHLPQIRTKQWLVSLIDALEPGGVLVLSFHSSDLLNATQRESLTDGILFLPRSESEVLSSLEYGTTYLSHEYLTREVQSIAGASIVGIYPFGLCEFQDLMVITRSKLD